MNLFSRSLPLDVVVVAEIGNNHEGEITVAKELIDAAKEAGADAVKFQTFIPEHLVQSSNVERMERLHRFQLSRDEFVQLKQHAEARGIAFFSTPFDIDSAEFVAHLCDVIKIASGDNTFYPLIKKVAGFNKPIVLSTGLADLDEVSTAVRLIQEQRAHHRSNAEIVILHCVSSYPVPPAQANLAAIETLKSRFGPLVGYSDHTVGIDAAVLSIGFGARLIEKHFTLDKNYSDYRDHQLSADPTELKKLVERVRNAVAMMGDGEKKPQACEIEGIESNRRSIAAARNIAPNEAIRPEHITWVRPGSGIAPGNENSVVGRRSKRAVKAGTILNIDELD